MIELRYPFTETAVRALYVERANEAWDTLRE